MKNLIIASSILLIASLTSCRKIIDVKVNDAATKYVIEGNVTDQDSGTVVTISKSIHLNASNEFPFVSGAEVSIKDINADITYNLSETIDGIYRAADLKGMYGHQYLLTIKIDGSLFSATSTMPKPVSLDSLYMAYSLFGTELRGVFNDPAGDKNFYHFTAFKNRHKEEGIVVTNDEVTDGRLSQQAILTRKDTAFHAGDRLTAVLECVDPTVYQYYYGLLQAADQSSATPANPTSNISGNVLGYFSAHTVSAKELILP